MGPGRGEREEVEVGITQLADTVARAPVSASALAGADDMVDWTPRRLRRAVEVDLDARVGRRAHLGTRPDLVDTPPDLHFRRQKDDLTATGTRSLLHRSVIRRSAALVVRTGTHPLCVTMTVGPRAVRDRRREHGPPDGTLVFVPPEGNRTAFAEEAEKMVLAVGSKVGQPYEVGGWEVQAEFHPAYEAGDYDAVIDRARKTLEASGYGAAALRPCLLRGTTPRAMITVIGPDPGGCPRS